MGYYISCERAKGKVNHLITNYAASVIPQPTDFSDVPQELALICVVDNGIFEAAAYAFNEREFLAFSRPGDRRPKTWLLMDKPVVHILTDYKER